MKVSEKSIAGENLMGVKSATFLFGSAPSKCQGVPLGGDTEIAPLWYEDFTRVPLLPASVRLVTSANPGNTPTTSATLCRFRVRQGASSCVSGGHSLCRIRVVARGTLKNSGSAKATVGSGRHGPLISCLQGLGGALLGSFQSAWI